MWTSSPADFTDPASAAAQLGVPVETMMKLRRVLDPALGFEEHRDIFPLDLGPLPDRAAFSAAKTCFDSRPGDYGFGTSHFPLDRVQLEWKAAIDRFSEIFRVALMGSCEPFSLTKYFQYEQSMVESGEAQRGTHVHVDHQNTLAALKESWQPPESLILLVRDVEPNTLFMKMFDHVPPALILGTCPTNQWIVFHEKAFMEKALAEGRVVSFSAGHVVAMTDRVFHAGQAVPTRRQQTFAHGTVMLKHASV